ncbi:hypothetical protein [Sphingomonas elodea]|uniref:hypothetical protein n=1 Tax=Sphingomonas elodea TaxID=179878 RepID=UPI0002631E42|nr:hypothetical protein [Sphingomonas elodea]
MQISEAIAGFASVVEAARAKLADVDAKIEAKEEEHRAIFRADPHTDDIVAVFLGELERVEDTFSEQLRTRLNDTYVGEGSAKAVALGRSMNILLLEPEKPDQQALMTRSLRGETSPPLNLTILTYFLRHRIALELPKLIDELCPAARDGIRGADRAFKIRQIEEELRELRAERERISTDLQAARSAVQL